MAKYEIIKQGCCTAFVQYTAIVEADSAEEARTLYEEQGEWDSEDVDFDIDDDYSEIRSVRKINE